MDDAHGGSAAGPGDEFVAWYRSRHRHLLATMIVTAGDADVAREVTDEAFARALERWPRVRAMTARDGWVYRVALHALRRRGRRAAMGRALVARAPGDGLAPPVDVDVDLWRALQSIAPRARTAIALRYVSDLTEADVATAMGVAPGTVARMLHDARRELAVLLREDEPVPVEMEEVSGDRPRR